MKKQGLTLIELMVIISIIVIIAAIAYNAISQGGSGNGKWFAGAMGNENAKASVLNCCKVNGFSDVKILDGETAWTSEDDTYFYRVSAVNSADKRVNFKVYWSQYRGATIRTD